MTGLQNHLKPDGGNTKGGLSSTKQSPWSSVQDRPTPLPSISQWYDDGSDSRRSSTASIASSVYIPSGAQSPVGPASAMELHEQTARRLHQVSEHMFASPYSSPGSTPGPEDHIIQKSKAKAKTRTVRGVSHAEEMELRPEAKAQAQVKANREKVSRFEQSWANSRGWEALLAINPNMLQEGVTRDGVRGLRPLKRNNINARIEKAGHIPNQINKDQLADLSAICIHQFLKITLRQIRGHRLAGRHHEADDLQEELRCVGTYI